MTENKQEKRKRRIFGRSFLFIVLFMAWIGNAVLRVLFGYMAATGAQLLDNPVAQSTMNVLVSIFLFLGVSGLIVAIGFWQKKKWGFLGAMTVILGTIVFDVWGMTIQYTAALGLVVPVLVLIYLVINRPMFLQTGGPSLDTSMR